jgi:hypothetical protein
MSSLYSDLLFAISHYTERVIEDLESHKRDRLEEVVYQSLIGTMKETTPFETFSSIAQTLINYLEHKNPVIHLRILTIIQRMIELGPRFDKKQIQSV